MRSRSYAMSSTSITLPEPSVSVHERLWYRSDETSWLTSSSWVAFEQNVNIPIKTSYTTVWPVHALAHTNVSRFTLENFSFFCWWSWFESWVIKAKGISAGSGHQCHLVGHGAVGSGGSSSPGYNEDCFHYSLDGQRQMSQSLLLSWLTGFCYIDRRYRHSPRVIGFVACDVGSNMDNSVPYAARCASLTEPMSRSIDSDFSDHDLWG